MDASVQFTEGKVDFIQNMLGIQTVLTKNDYKMCRSFDGIDDCSCIVIGLNVSWCIPDSDAIVFQSGTQIVSDILIFGRITDKC